MMKECVIQGVRVDLAALSALRHRCEPMKCLGRERGCCETYEVYVDPREMGTIVGSMPDAARHARGLRSRGDFIDPFEDTDGGSCLATDPHGRCVFAYRDRAGATLCSLHSAALKHGLPPVKVKPKACALWPLFLVEGKRPLLTVQDGARDFPCNHTRRAAARGLDAGVAGIVRDVFGEEFLAELNAEMMGA
jgi:hypothetical protein